jgi:RNA-binding protein
MTAIELSPSARKLHRAQAQHLRPVVMVGTDGLSEAVTREVDAALNAHGLIKVRAMVDDRAARERMLQGLAVRLGAAAVQHIGKLLVLWRPKPAPGATAGVEQGKGAAGKPRVVKLVTFPKSGTHRPSVKRVKVLGNQRVTAGGKVKRANPRTSSVKKKLA